MASPPGSLPRCGGGLCVPSRDPVPSAAFITGTVPCPPPEMGQCARLCLGLARRRPTGRVGAVCVHFGHGNPQEEEGKAVRVEDSGGRGKASGEAQRRRALDSLPPQARDPSEVGLLTGGCEEESAELSVSWAATHHRDDTQPSAHDWGNPPEFQDPVPEERERRTRTGQALGTFLTPVSSVKSPKRETQADQHLCGKLGSGTLSGWSKGSIW